MAYPRTPEEITSAWLAGVLDVDEADIESVSVDFVGDAIGNTSDVYFVRITSRGSANLPQSLVAKMVPRFEGAVEVCKVLKLFEREIEIYRQVAGPSEMRTPELVWSDYDPETSLGFMLMEDCSCYEGIDQTAPVPTSVAQLRSIVASSARLHARWWNKGAIHPAVLEPGDPVRTAFFSVVQQGWQGLLGGGPGSETIPESGRKVAQCFADNLMDLAENHWPTTNLTVTHLDFRLDNMFFDPARNEAVVFDWQGTSLGRGPYDIAYLLCTGYAPEFRRQHEKAVFEHYYDVLVEEGVTGYSFDEAWQDFRFGMVYSLWVVPFTAILDMSSERGQKLANKIIGGIFSAIEDHGADDMLYAMFPDAAPRA